MFTKLSVALIYDLSSGLWPVLFTECDIRAAAYFLAETYDQYPIWYFSFLFRAAI